MRDKWKHVKIWTMVIAMVSGLLFGISHPDFSHVETAFITIAFGFGVYTIWVLLKWLQDAMPNNENLDEETEQERFIVKGGRTIRVSLKQVGRYVDATTRTPMYVTGYHVDRLTPDMATSYTDAPVVHPIPSARVDTNHSPQFVNMDAMGNIQFLSSSLLERFDIEFEAVLGRPIHVMPHVFGHDTEAMLRTVHNHYYAHHVFHTMLSGKETWLLWTYEAILDAEGHIDFIIAMLQDISETMPRALGQDFQPERDYLTGELNQVGLYKQIATMHTVHRAASMFIDIRQFSKINDYYGHHLGDKILLAMAQKLRRYTGETGIISRVSGDKFVLFLTEQEATPDAVNTLIGLLEGFLTQELQIEGVTVPLETAIGYALYPEDCQTLDGLVALSSLAMEASAASKAMEIKRYKPSMRAALHYDFLLAHKLKQALENNALEVHFQHVVDATNNEVVYLEALGRWFDEDLGQVSPQTFFQAAEATHLLDSLDRLLTEKAIRTFKQLRTYPHYQHARLSLNIAPDSLLDAAFFQHVNAAVKAHGLKCEDICIEVSEKTFVSRIDQCRDAIQKYKDNGYVVALDDFGKEYSSLAILDHLTFDIIKIDGAFTQSIDTVKSREIVKMIRNITRLSGKALIIEGVETRAQSDAVLELGCPLQQGYFHHRPERLD